MLILISSVVVVASGLVVLHDWGGTPATVIPGIALIADDHVPIGAFLPQDDPSIDLYPNVEDPAHPTLQGVFRLNPIHLDSNDGKVRIGLVLPLESQFLPGKPGPHNGVIGNVIETGQSPRASSGEFSCDPVLIKAGASDARKAVSFFNGDLSWTVDCRSYGAVIWTDLPSKTDGTRAYIDPSRQALNSDTAAEVAFRLPDYGGIVRRDFADWSFAINVETGRDVPGMATKKIPDVVKAGHVYSIVALHAAKNEQIRAESPSGSSSRVVTYFNEQATVWPLKLDGSVQTFSANETLETFHWWESALAFAAPLLIGVVLTLLAEWVFRQFRSRNE